MIPEYLKQYCEYIKNTGGAPTTAMFDEDWEPIGPRLRADMARADLITEIDGVLRLTPTGEGK